MPASRPYWKGYIKLALVSCPIAVYTASSSGERVTFRQINKKTGNRLRQQLIDDETREPVEAEDKGRGYEVGKNQYLLIPDEELEAIEIESNHTIDIGSFVPRAEIDERYLDSPYYIVPNEPVGTEAFAVIREAMRGKGMVALGRVVLAKRERVMMLQPWENGILGMTLRYPYEVREAAGYFQDIPDVKVEKELLTLAEHILETKAQRFDPSEFADRYEEAVVAMLKTKQAGMPAPTTLHVARPQTVVNLFEALRQSLTSETKAAPPHKAAKPKKGKAAATGQREMLLPIAGKKALAAPPSEKRPVVSPGPRDAPAGRKKAG